MTPEDIRTLPRMVLILGLLGVVVVLVLLLVGLLALVAGAVRRRDPADGPSLADRAEPMLRARRGAGRTDAKFDRLAQGTMLGLSGESAGAWVFLTGAVVAVGVYLLALSFPAFPDPELAAAAAALFAGGMVFVALWTLRNRRRRAIQEQLPDGLFQLARSLRSGLALPDALRETSHYVPAPLAGLFDRLAAALALGESVRAAVRRAAADAELTEFDLFAEVLVLNTEAGGNLPAMLDRLAASVRDRNLYRGYFRSVTALSRISATFLALAAPAAFLLYLVFPDQREMMLKFLRAREGQMMLIAAVVLEVLGLLWIALLLRRQDDY